MKLKEVLDLTYEGTELGILDSVSFRNSSKKMIAFVYGGLESGNYFTHIWFDDNQEPQDLYKKNCNELIRRVADARKESSKG